MVSEFDDQQPDRRMTEPNVTSCILESLASGDSLSCREIATACGVSRRAVAQLLHSELRAQLARDALFCWRLRDEEDPPVSSIDGIEASSRTFVASFLGRRELTRPDGRELYKYRCSEAEFEALHLAISDIVDFDPLGRSQPYFAPLFVLYAAEWWRRHQGTGAWAWEPVFESLELQIENIGQIYPAVTRGLDAWKRPLLKNLHGRMFLVTLACEGGLPLQVMKSEGTRLREFFRQVLEDYGLYSRTGVPASELARRNERYLRRSLRQQIVFELGGQLVETIWALQSRVRGAKDPVAELDNLEPDWRQQLPFEVDDGVAAAFLNNLVQTAHRIRQGTTDEFRLSRSLVHVNGWTLQANLSFPPMVDEAWMVGATGLTSSDLPQRGQFVLTSSGGRKRPALNVTQRYRGAKVGYMLERLDGVDVEGPLAAEGWSIQFESNRCSGGRREIRGGTALSAETPWIFTEVDEGCWRFIGQGSVRTRFSECAVALPPALASEKGERIGEVLGREVRRIDESVDLLDPEGERFRLLLAQKEEQAIVVQVEGDRFDQGSDDREVFLGLPILREIVADGRLQTISHASIQWRAIGTKEWRSWGHECLGRVSVRVVHVEETRFLQTFEILPKDFSVRLKGDSATAGSLQLESQIPFAVRPADSEEVTAEVVECGTAVTVSLRVETAKRVPATVTVQLDFGEDRRTSLSLSFPARGARSVGRADRIIPFGGSVSVDELSLCRFEVFATGGKRRFTIDAVLNAYDVSQSEMIVFPFDLPEPRNGRIVLELRRLAPDIQGLLSETDDGEAFVSLTVDGVGPNKLEVRRYDVDFEVELGRDVATLPPAVPPDTVSVEMIPLWEPGAPREPLSFNSALGGWPLSRTSRAAGPWLLIGRTQDSVSIRPRLVPVDGEVVARPPLATAISLRQFQAREAIKVELQALSERPLDEEWNTILTIVKLSAELPASSFHVTAALCQNAAAAVLVLIHAGADRQLVWDTLARAGLDWTVVSFQTWHDTLSAFEAELAEQLVETTPSADDIAAAEITSLLQFLEESPERSPMQATWVFLRKHLFDLRGNQGGIVGADPDSVLPGLQAERSQLVTRQVDARWPNGPRLVAQIGKTNDAFKAVLRRLGATNFRTAVIAAPLFAARSAAVGEHVGRRLRGELRRLRRFDSEWFDAAYRLALVKYLNNAYPGEVD